MGWTVILLSAAVGLLVGGLLGMGWGWWRQSALSVWTAQRDEMLVRMDQQAAIQVRSAEVVRLARQQQLAQARDVAWQERRTQLIRLHTLLGRVAAEQGLRVQQWQGHDKQLQVQASLPRAQDWSVLQAQLTDAGPQAWQLHSLAQGADARLQLVLEAFWTAPAQAAQAKRP